MVDQYTRCSSPSSPSTAGQQAQQQQQVHLAPPMHPPVLNNKDSK